MFAKHDLAINCNKLVFGSILDFLSLSLQSNVSLSFFFFLLWVVMHLVGALPLFIIKKTKILV